MITHTWKPEMQNWTKMTYVPDSTSRSLFEHDYKDVLDHIRGNVFVPMYSMAMSVWVEFEDDAVYLKLNDKLGFWHISSNK